MLTPPRQRLGLGLLVATIVAFSADARADERADPPEVEPEGPPRPPAPGPAPPPPEEPPPEAVNASPAPRQPRFGAKGEVVVNADADIGLGWSEHSGSDRRQSGSASFSPGLDYFVVRGLSIGFTLVLSYDYARAYGADNSLVAVTTTTIAGGPRFGLNVPLGDFVSFYPRLTAGIESAHRETVVVQGKAASIADPLGVPSMTLAGPYVYAFLPLLLHPRPHFFLGAGPGFFHEFGRAQVDPSLGGERTSWSGRVTVGGWWGGDDRTAQAAAEPPSVATTPRFGEEGQWVITGQAGASVVHSTYGGVDAPRTTFSVAPGADYFPVSRVSVGASAFGSHGQSVGRQPDGTRVESRHTAGGISGRIGVDAPLGASFSWYPRATLSFREQHWEGSSGKDRYDTTLDIVSVGLYAPVLFHAASHFFVGFGPYVTHDVKSTGEGTPSDNFGTSVGADLLVGGWL